MGRYDLLQWTRGLGRRNQDPTQAFWSSLEPTGAKVFEKLWLEWA